MMPIQTTRTCSSPCSALARHTVNINGHYMLSTTNVTVTNRAIQTLAGFSSSSSDSSQVQVRLAVPQRRHALPTSPHGLQLQPGREIREACQSLLLRLNVAWIRSKHQ